MTTPTQPPDNDPPKSPEYKIAVRGDVNRGIIPWFTRNPVAANLLMFTIVIGGLLVGLNKIQVETFPESPPDSLSINMSYPGADPEEVERSIVVKIEEAIQDIEGIRELDSRASEGRGSVQVEVEEGYDINRVLDDVKTRVDAINTFPDLVEPPRISQDIWRRDVASVINAGDASEQALKVLGEQIRDEIVSLPNVTQAELNGVRNYEINIEITEETLREYGLTLEQVANTIRRSSQDLPSGAIDSVGGDILLRSIGQAYNKRDFENIVLLQNPDGTRLLLGDVANVVDGFTDFSVVSVYDGKPGVNVEVFRVGDQSVLEVTQAVRDYVEERKASLPPGLTMRVDEYQATILKDRINLMVKNAAFGGLLVLIALTLFLRLKVALWVAIGIPISFFGALLLMPYAGATINMLSLFAFILVLGIVVDDAIVVGENIYTTVRRDGHSIENVIKGAQEVAMPATFGVLTTIAAFLPVLMLSGRQGERWAIIGTIVILCLIFSLVESKLILPAHLAESDLRLKSRKEMGFLSRMQRKISDGLHVFVDRYYKPVLRKAVHWRYLTLAIFVSSIIITIGMIQGGILRVVFFPRIESSFTRLNLEMTEGTPEKELMAAVDRIQRAIFQTTEQLEAENPGIKVLDSYRLYSRGETQANFFVRLNTDQNVLTPNDFTIAWRRNIGEIPGVEEMQAGGRIGGRGGKPIVFQLEGKDTEQLSAATSELKEHIATYDHVFDITDSYATVKQELKLRIKPEAEVLGLTLQDLGRQVRYAFFGAEAQRIQRGEDEVRVMVRYPKSERSSVGDLEDMFIRMPDGTEVPFAQVAEVEAGRGYSAIRRFDRKRSQRIYADVDKDSANPLTIINSIEENYMPDLLDRYPGVTYQVRGEAQDTAETNREMMINTAMAMLVIFALLAIPLKSYWKPLVIMSVIPFGVVGAVFGHWLLEQFGMYMPISILSLSGIIALSGVVVNDSLVMVDFITRGQENGLSKFDAVMEAGPRRFRAIMLTSLTTFLGLLPMLAETSRQAEFLKPMAVSLAFGILFATVITLLLVPSLYLIIYDINDRFTAFFRWYFSSSRKDKTDVDYREAASEQAPQPASHT